MDNKFIIKLLSWATHIEKDTGFSWDGFWASKNNETQLFRAVLSTMIATNHMWLCTLKFNKIESQFLSHADHISSSLATRGEWLQRCINSAETLSISHCREVYWLVTEKNWMMRVYRVLLCFSYWLFLASPYQFIFSTNHSASIRSHLLNFLL